MHLLIHLDTSSVIAPAVIKGVGSFNHRSPHPGDLTMSEQFLRLYPSTIHDPQPSRSFLYSCGSSTDGLGLVLMACLSQTQVMPRRVKALHRNFPAPRGMHQACHPHWWHSSSSLAYLFFFNSLASFICSSYGTVSSSMTICSDVSRPV